MYTKENLEEKTVAELRSICRYDLEISGMSKKRKDVIIGAILDTVIQRQPIDNPHPVTLNKSQEKTTAIEASFRSNITKPEKKFGDRTTTLVKVSCGANTGDFSVTGKKVGSVAEMLREVLNVDRLSRGIVNGEYAEDTYELKPGDSLEFIKDAGVKG